MTAELLWSLLNLVAIGANLGMSAFVLVQVVRNNDTRPLPWIIAGGLVLPVVVVAVAVVVELLGISVPVAG